MTVQTEGQYFLVQLEKAYLVVYYMALRLGLFPFNLPTVKIKKKHTVYDRFRGNGPYGKILTEQNSRIYFKTTLPYHKE